MPSDWRTRPTKSRNKHEDSGHCAPKKSHEFLYVQATGTAETVGRYHARP